MQHAIKYGHPQRIQRMIKFWLPIYYAAGSYNYANKCMELLHNMIHDWPKDFAQVVFNGMLVNPSGKAGEFKPTDIRVEHLNDQIKERAHGSNATPNLLSKITPAMGHLSQLTDRLFSDLNIEHQNQQHIHVSQHRDIELLVKHFIKQKIFDFNSDARSEHAVVDLYQSGCIQLAGKNTGYSNHLKRHILRLCVRHGAINSPNSASSLLEDTELAHARDSQQINFTAQEYTSEYEGMLGQSIDNSEMDEEDAA